MAGYISEFFGFNSYDKTPTALKYAQDKKCPFLGKTCTKYLAHQGVVSGACAIRQKKVGSPSVVCCPNRLYADSYKMLHDIALKAFGENLNMYAGRTAVEMSMKDGGAIAVFGHEWGGELRLPQRQGTGSYFVDWVLARLNSKGELTDFTAIEVQTIDTTGKYSDAQRELLKNRNVIYDTVGFNWENVAKRIIPQIIYKGQILQREDLCQKGLFFVSPKPVHDRVLARLGGKSKLPEYPIQPASIHFVAYDYAEPLEKFHHGNIAPLTIVEEYCTTVYKIQEAFSAFDLPEGNVYGNAIRRSLYGELSSEKRPETNKKRSEKKAEK
ncbi:MAG: restriction endonuclease [Lentisphaeria bacterium]|nr:restriction endonuclease [Lentisphaeria bacterium]